jgi:Protein of unknown function (DUF1003)
MVGGPRHGIVVHHHRPERDPDCLDHRQLGGRDEWAGPYPFIRLNLALSFQAVNAAPVIMMSQNRQQDIDRKAAENDYRINVKAELEIEGAHRGCQSADRAAAAVGFERAITARPMPRADSCHNTWLWISWRDVISYSLRGIPFFDGTVLVSRTTAQRVCATMTVPSPVDGGNPPWSLVVLQAATPDQNDLTGFPRDSTSSTISRCLRPAPRRGSSPQAGRSR